MSALNFSSSMQSLIPEELIPLVTLAACILMAANQKLSPADAIGDVLQVYDSLERRQPQ